MEALSQCVGKMRKGRTVWAGFVFFLMVLLIGLFPEQVKAAPIYEEVESYVEFEGVPIESPFGVAVDANGNIYIVDKDRILIFDDNRVEIGSIQIDYAIFGVLSIKDDVLYAADGRDIYKFDLNNNYEQIGDEITIENTGGYQISGLAFDSQGNLLVNTYYTLYKVTPTEQVVQFINYDPLGMDFINSKGIAVDEHDTIYVLAHNEFIHRWDSAGNFLGTWEYAPSSTINYDQIAYHQGALYLTNTDFLTRGFRKFSAQDGRLLGVFSENEMYYHSFDIAIHPVTGRVYMASQRHDADSGVWVYKDIGSTTNVSVSSDEIMYGEQVTITVTVSANDFESPDPTGTVTLMDGTEEIEVLSLIDGEAATTITSLPAGNRKIRAIYSGDGFYPEDTSDAVAILVNKFATSTNLLTSKANIEAGESVTFTATVSVDDPGSGTPTGTVTFKDDSEVIAVETLDSGTASVTVSNLSVGDHTITAVYSGDNVFAESEDSLQQIVSKASTVTTLTAMPVESVYAEDVTLTATVTAVLSALGTPTGDVTFSNGPDVLGTVPLDANGEAQLQVNDLAVDTHTITAVYEGDSVFATSNDSISYEVAKAATTTTVTTTPAASVYGESVTLTAEIAIVSPGSGTPTGAVTFTANGEGLGTAPLVDGVATLSGIADLAVDTHTIEAIYGGDSSFEASSGTTSHHVTKADTTTTVTVPAGSVYGESVTLTAEVVAVSPGSGTPTGTVTFTANGEGLGTAPMVGGVATLSDIADLAVASYTIDAVYSGDSSFVSSSGSTSHHVTKSATTTTVTTAPAGSVYGEGVTLTAEVVVVGSGGGTPTGTVTFTANGEELGSAPLVGGVATLSGLADLAVDAYTIDAVYSGDSSFEASSGTTSHHVTKADTTTMVTIASAGSVYGESVTITAEVAAVSPGNGTPTGTVTFMHQSTELKKVNLDNGVASLELDSLPVGMQTIEAYYNGDQAFHVSNGQTDHEVSRASSMTVATSVTDSVYGEQVTFQVAVTAISPGGGVPTGTVKLVDGVKELDEESLNSSGMVEFQLNDLLVGDYVLHFEYSGDSSFVNSSDSLIHTVAKAFTQTSVTESVYGVDQVKLDVTVTAIAPGKGTPTGSVKFMDGTLELAEKVLDNGQATWIVDGLAPGDHTIVVMYSGDESFRSSAGSVGQNVDRVASTTTVTTSRSSSVYGETVELTAKVEVTELTFGSPTGTVEFWLDSTSLGTAYLIGDTATLLIDDLPAGDHVIVAEYSGADWFHPSYGTVQLKVNKATTVASLTASKTTAMQGEAISLTAVITVELPGSGKPTGNVTFWHDQELLGEVILTEEDDGVATLGLANGLISGEYDVHAVYDGDLQFNSSASPAIQLTIEKPAVPSPSKPSRRPSAEPSTPALPDPVVSTDGEIQVPPGGSGIASFEERITVQIPEGISDEGVRLTIEEVVETSGLLDDEEELVSNIYEVLSNLTGTFRKPLTITIVFDATLVAEGQRASIFYFDEEERVWVEVGGTVQDNEITAVIDHLTKFAVFAVDAPPSSPGDSMPQVTLSDIQGHWAEANITRAMKDQIVSGYPDGTFRPNESITRVEFTVMLMNGLKLQLDGEELSFVDRQEIGEWAARAVSQAVQVGIVQGYDDGSFKPSASISRVEMVMMIANALPNDFEGELARPNHFVDEADIPTWAKHAVDTVQALGIVNGRDGNLFAPYEQASRAEAVAMILRMLELP